MEIIQDDSTIKIEFYICITLDFLSIHVYISMGKLQPMILSEYFKEKILLTEEDPPYFSLFLRQILINVVFSSKNCWGTFNVKLLRIFFSSAACLMMSLVLCGPLLEKGCSWIVYIVNTNTGKTQLTFCR